jgi:hypothetical protein
MLTHKDLARERSDYIVFKQLIESRGSWLNAMLAHALGEYALMMQHPLNETDGYYKMSKIQGAKEFIGVLSYLALDIIPQKPSEIGTLLPPDKAPDKKLQ